MRFESHQPWCAIYFDIKDSDSHPLKNDAQNQPGEWYAKFQDSCHSILFFFFYFIILASLTESRFLIPLINLAGFLSVAVWYTTFLLVKISKSIPQYFSNHVPLKFIDQWMHKLHDVEFVGFMNWLFSPFSQDQNLLRDYRQRKGGLILPLKSKKQKKVWP